MDANHFDRWTRSLATARTRRGVVTAVGAAALAALLGGDPELVAADRSRRHQRRRSGPPDTPCGVAGHPCSTQQPCCAGLSCGASVPGAVRRCAPCPGGLCAGACDPACPTGQQCCDGRCVDVATDPKNCGFCGNRCRPGLACVGGDCQGGCNPQDPNVQVCPDGACCDTAACQECQGPTCVNQCQPGQRCDQSHGALGVCVCDAQSCPKGCCQGGPFGQCLVNDTQRCGHGGGTCAPCPSRQTCCGGECCGGTTGKTCCNGACVDTSADVANCGACGNACGLDPAGNARQCCGGECCEPVNDIICCRYPEGHVCCPRGEFCCATFSPFTCCAGPP